MDMEKIIHYNSLYDCYKPLFTEKQQLYFQDYYFNNLSLGEIADNNNVSRNAVHNQLRIIEARLDELEVLLGLCKKRKEVIRLLNGKVDDELLEKIKNIL